MSRKATVAAPLRKVVATERDGKWLKETLVCGHIVLTHVPKRRCWQCARIEPQRETGSLKLRFANG